MSPSIKFTAVRRLLAGAALVAGIGLTARPAEAQSNEKTFYACYVPGSGTVYRIKSTNTPAGCKKSTHVFFLWTDFMSALNPVIEQSSLVLPAGEEGTVIAQCQSGSIMYTGGYALLTDEDVRVIRNHPHTSPVPNTMNAWVVTAKNASAGPHTVIAYARCASR
jgi:hypothetical protein